jgi:two-component system chemotaxis response regulator CheY
MKILVVDDSQAMRRIVARAVREAGYSGHEFVEAENGRRALEIVRRERPDLILSDWHMPVLDGLELLRALRAERVDVPFGFVASEATEPMIRAAAAAGAVFLLAKPFTTEDMAQVLQTALPSETG